MKKVKMIALDSLRAILIGAAFGAVWSLLLFLGGLLFGGGMEMAWTAARSGTLLTASLGLFLIAGMILTKGKKPEKFAGKDSWRKHFRILGYRTVFAIVCVMLLIYASVFDFILYHA